MIEFIITAVGISLSGVLAPGPITAATLAAGMRNRHAGLLIALGHIAIELPTIVLLVIGLGDYLQSPRVQTGIGLAGGVFLLFMGVQLLLSLRRPLDESDDGAVQRPFWTGLLLTATSPYFWIWGAAVGLRLTSQALEFGILALVLFALIHWSLDLGWLEVLSQAGHKGSEVFGERSRQVVSLACAVMLLGFGLKFLCDAGIGLTPPAHAEADLSRLERFQEIQTPPPPFGRRLQGDGPMLGITEADFVGPGVSVDDRQLEGACREIDPSFVRMPLAANPQRPCTGGPAQGGWRSEATGGMRRPCSATPDRYGTGARGWLERLDLAVCRRSAGVPSGGWVNRYPGKK